VVVHGVRPGLRVHGGQPPLRIALSIVALLPTPQLRTTALLDVMRAKVTRRSGMTDTPCRSAAHRRGGLAH
jgi:hypothetical protein